MQGIAVLGSTGSIGTQTLDIVRAFSRQFKIIALTARANIDLLFNQAVEFSPQYVHVEDLAAAKALSDRFSVSDINIPVLTGQELSEIVCHPEVDKILAAMSGACGCWPVLEALKAGKTVCLANKEPIVMAGSWLIKALDTGRIIPVDSEHSAIYQVLGQDYVIGSPIADLDRVILTASGGPFWQRSLQDCAGISVEEALRHPTWNMGAKISIDSATLMNKGLELIEAKWLFGLEPNQLDVLIHPQSIVHSIVEYQDGSQIAQLGVPDMRLSIAYSLFGQHAKGVVPRCDLTAHPLAFHRAKPDRFKALELVAQVLAGEQHLACIFNAANEVAVAAFLRQQIGFLDITGWVERALDQFSHRICKNLDDILQLDTQVRQEMTAYA